MSTLEEKETDGEQGPAASPAPADEPSSPLLSPGCTSSSSAAKLLSPRRTAPRSRLGGKGRPGRAGASQSEAGPSARPRSLEGLRLPPVPWNVPPDLSPRGADPWPLHFGRDGDDKAGVPASHTPVLDAHPFILTSPSLLQEAFLDFSTILLSPPHHLELSLELFLFHISQAWVPSELQSPRGRGLSCHLSLGVGPKLPLLAAASV